MIHRDRKAFVQGEEAWPADPRLAALWQAHTTMVAGCRMLIARAASDIAPTAPINVRMRMAGNHLKELDRFLALLLRARGQVLRTAGGRGAMMPPRLQACWPRLRAVRRLRLAASDSLSALSGTGLRRDLAMAACGVGGPAAPAPAPVEIGDAALAEIARFYLFLAEALVIVHLPPVEQHVAP
ncbi:hypothetical protein GTZ99_08845 [Novosphingobium sp. FSY-8]|uniref:Uncharacterized protein n=1 Tax=Novosphingobium ovatum TaxID=1908523 RepID=A0ABW9XDQ4_9SPHN|nr:hypothetical protein [Novosphingobium ovatum]NBC36664.1 hypothetical protein [Novosphingobium ovatum]